MSCLQVLAQVGCAALWLTQNTTAETAPEVTRWQLIEMNLYQRCTWISLIHTQHAVHRHSNMINSLTEVITLTNHQTSVCNKLLNAINCIKNHLLKTQVLDEAGTSSCAHTADYNKRKNKDAITSHVQKLNPLKHSGIRWLHFKVFSAIQV